MYIFNSFYLLHSYNQSSLICLCFNMVSFRGKKKLRLDHAQIGLLKGFNSKFPTSIPTPFICRVPLPTGDNETVCYIRVSVEGVPL